MEADTHHPTPPPPASAVATAGGEVAKRVRKRSRYLSPPYADVDEGGKQQQHQHQHDDHEEDEEEQPPPNVATADVLSALHAAAVLDPDSQNPTAAEALRFLALFKRRMRTTTTTTTLLQPDSPSSPAPAVGAGQKLLGDAISTGPTMPLPMPRANGSFSPANKKKKKNPQHPPPAVASVNNATAGAANSAPPKKRKKKTKNAGQEQQHFEHPVALILDFAKESAPLPSDDHLLSTFRGFGSVRVHSEAAEGGGQRARVIFATRAQAEAARSCAGALRGGAFGSLPAPPRLEDLPPITLSAPPSPPVRKLPLTDIRKNLETMITDLTCRSSSSTNTRQQAKPVVGDLLREMQGLLAKVDKRLQGQGASSTDHHH